MGDIDLTGIRRPASYLREIVFGLRENPYITVQNPHRYGQHLMKTPWIMSDNLSSWTWQGCEGKPVIVEVYAPGTEAELFRNGESLGKQASGKAAGYRVLFETTYEPGALTAVAYENGQEISRFELATAGADRSSVLVFGSEEIMDELIYVPVTYCDAAGTVATDADQTIKLAVSGGATVIGFGSGNPQPETTLENDETQTFNGQAMIVLKKNAKAENVRLDPDGSERSCGVFGTAAIPNGTGEPTIRVPESVKL